MRGALPIGPYAFFEGWGSPPASSYGGTAPPIGIFAHYTGWATTPSGGGAPAAVHQTGFHVNMGSMMGRR